MGTMTYSDGHPDSVLLARAQIHEKFHFWSVLLGERITVYTTDIETAGVTTEHLYINPNWIETHQHKHRVFILAHELMHCVLAHPERSFAYWKLGHVNGLPFNKEIANYAIDFIINDFVARSGLDVPPDGCYDPKFISAEDDYVSAYEKMFQRAVSEGKIDPKTGQPKEGAAQAQPSNGPGRPGGNGEGDVDPNMQANEDASPSQGDVSEAVEKGLQALARARDHAKARGTMPGNFLELIDGMLESKVPWEEMLRAELVGKAGRDTPNYRAMNRRLMVMPGIIAPAKSGFKSGPGAIFIDSSGSVTDKELAAFAPEAGSILEDIKPERLHVVICDARIQSHDVVDDMTEAEDYIRMRFKEKGIGGRSGTSFEPPFKLMDEEFPDVEWVVYMTDMECSFPTARPSLQMIWLATTDIVAPWGRTIKLEI